MKIENNLEIDGVGKIGTTQFVGSESFIVRSHNSSGFGGMYVAANGSGSQPFYGYAVDNQRKAWTYYIESNGIKSLNWNIAGGDKMELDGSGIWTLKEN